MPPGKPARERPWNRQDRKARIRTRADWSKPILTGFDSKVGQLLPNSKTLTYEEKRRFVMRHIKELEKLYHQSKMLKPNKRLAIGAIGKEAPAEMENHFNFLMKQTLLNANKKMNDKLLAQAKHLLNARGIPYNEKAARLSAQTYIKQLKEKTFGIFDARAFEKIYVHENKKVRENEQKLSIMVNIFSNAFFKVLSGLTLNQKKIMKKIIREEYLRCRKEHPELWGERMDEGTHLLFEEYIKPRFIELGKTLAGKRNPESVSKPTPTSRKLGDRETRIREYEPREREENDRRKQVMAMLLQTPKEFNSTEYLLNEIQQKRPEEAALFRQKISQRKLARGEFERLYVAGSLAMYQYYRVISEFGIEDALGPKSVNAAARIIGLFGGFGGRKTDWVTRKLTTPLDREVYRFLDSHELFETWHRGGTWTYLHRPGTKRTE